MSDIRLERVLRATARIAGIAMALGCAPTVATVQVPESVHTYDDVPEPDPYPEPDPEPECADLFEDLVADAEDGEIADLDEATLECCEDMIEHIDTTQEWPTEPVEQQAQWVCCQALDWPQSLACTPWGPPAPPAMPAELRPVALPEQAPRAVA